MESYPEDLLVGVFPLVFAVNAIFDPNNPDNDSEPDAGATNAAANIDAAVPYPKNRSDFDRFLDAMAGSLADENDEAADNNAQLEFPPILQTETPSSSRNVSIFRPDDDEMDESTDEDLLIDTDEDDYASAVPGSRGSRRVSTGNNAMRLYAGFGLTRRSLASGGVNSHSSTNTSYAKALQQGQGFFQRARIVSISTKHGFPPSKDPDGTKSIVFDLKQARTSIQKAREIFTVRPIQGILPAGWLEKHVYALPSVVLVVVKLSKANQSEQDAQLLKTVESLHYSLVPKRTCKVHVVGLVDDDIGVSQAQQWSLDMSREIVDMHANTNNSSSSSNNNHTTQQESTHQITLLRAGNDLRSGTDGFPTSIALKRLHRCVRDSSLMYYLGQTRRNKEKLAKLSEGGKKRISGARVRVQPPKELLPLAIRYCFKIAIYYEFQLKFEKSLKFMAEAYRHVRTYYHHLIRLSTRGSDLSDDEDDRNLADSGVERKPISASNISISTGGDAEDMEVSITESATAQGTSDVNAQWTSGVPPPPSDMAHQCLAVADWLNFKLLQAGFGSHTEGGLLAADGQWRQHSRVFCARRFLGGHPIMCEEWYFWCQVAHQRLVMSQLVERHPPKALGDLGNEYDEVLIRCAPWRAYEAAAEAYLRAGVGVEKALSKRSTTENSGEKDDSRAPFVGGLDKDGLAPVLEKASKIDHKAKALELVLRAISMFEHEWGKEKLKDAEDQFPHRPWGRFGARLYYLAGGILLSKQQYAEATGHLENAAKYITGWNGIEEAVCRLLAECYEKNAPATLGERESSLRISSMVMDACFYAKMSPANLCGALGSCSAVVKTPLILWSSESFDEFNTRLPFSFSITFPKMTHATAGDTVLASVLIRSNLDYAASLEAVTLLSMAGQIMVPRSDFSSDSAGNVVLAAGKQLAFKTPITLPKNLDDIAVDESGTDAKSKTNSYTKSARPRTAAITSAAGGRLVSEELFPKKARNSEAQWSLHFLGGKPMRCDGMRLVLRPLDADGTEFASVKPIELTIEKKKKAKTAANIKRTPFEEDNYIASAWSRPFHMPLPSGPRCLRVLGPMSDMEITNLSQSVSAGSAIEGTVNRICLKLRAGPEEMCSDIRYMIKCSSTLVTGDGAIKNLTSEVSTGDNDISMKGPGVRAPVIVTKNPTADAPEWLDYGFVLPVGWELVGSGQESTEEMAPKATSLCGGESTFLCFQLFRPSELSSGTMMGAEGPPIIASICETHFEVSVSYKQERQDGQNTAGGKESGSGEKKISENVSQKFSGSVTWASPMVVSYGFPTQNPTPSGSRHPSNLTDDARPSDTSIFMNVPMVDGDRISVRSTLESNDNVNYLDLEIAEVRFETSNEMPCRLTLTSCESSSSYKDESLYRASEKDPSRWLTNTSKFSFVYNVHAEMISKKLSATFPLGNVAVDWLPKQIALPDEAKAALGPEIEAHGPLVLASPIPMKFKGPLCYIEKAPFKTQFQCQPPVPKVAVPFHVDYSITNETDTHQNLVLALDGQPGSGQKSQDILICGLLGGDLRLAPHETKMLSYTVIATRSGMTNLPAVSISSARFNAWVVNERKENARPLCILP